MSRSSIPDEPLYCGNCGASLLSNRICPNGCPFVTSLNPSSANDPTVPVVSPLLRLSTSALKRKRVYQIAAGVLILLLLTAGVLGTVKSRKSSTKSTNIQPGNQATNGTNPQASAALTPTSSAARPIALVYKNDGGAAGCEGCADAVAALLQSDTTYHFDVRYVGPNESLSVQEGLTLPGVVLYAQPGGNGTVEEAYSEMRRDVPVLRNFVKNGGRLLGFCLGGYLLGTGPGFNLLSDVGGDTDEYITSPGASVTTEVNTIIQVNWRGKPRPMFFQDGNYFTFRNGTDGATVLATYSNGEVAAVVAPYGKGKVGGVGPHPEADASWYSAYNLTYPGSTVDLGHDLIDTTMQ